MLMGETRSLPGWYVCYVVERREGKSTPGEIFRIFSNPGDDGGVTDFGSIGLFGRSVGPIEWKTDELDAGNQG